MTRLLLRTRPRPTPGSRNGSYRALWGAVQLHTLWTWTKAGAEALGLLVAWGLVALALYLLFF